jgi:hypothetical protein
MKKPTIQVCLAMLAVAGSAVAQSVDDAKQCREGSLDGLYVFSATGYTIVGGVAQPKAIVELIRFDGGGQLTVPGATRSVNGVITVIPPGGTGSYTLNADCRGTLTFSGGPSFDIFASPKGEDFWMIQTNPNNVFQGNVTRVSHN